MGLLPSSAQPEELRHETTLLEEVEELRHATTLLEEAEEVGEEEAAVRGTTPKMIEAEWLRIKANDAALIQKAKSRAAACAALTHTLDRRMPIIVPPPQPQPQPPASWLDRIFEQMKSSDAQIQLLGRRGGGKRSHRHEEEKEEVDCEPRVVVVDETPLSTSSVSPCLQQQQQQQQQQHGKRRCTWSVDDLESALKAFELRNTCTTLAAWCPAGSVVLPGGTTPRLARHAARQASRRGGGKACRSQRRAPPLSDNMGDLDYLFCRLGTA